MSVRLSLFGFLVNSLTMACDWTWSHWSPEPNHARKPPYILRVIHSVLHVLQCTTFMNIGMTTQWEITGRGKFLSQKKCQNVRIFAAFLLGAHCKSGVAGFLFRLQRRLVAETFRKCRLVERRQTTLFLTKKEKEAAVKLELTSALETSGTILITTISR